MIPGSRTTTSRPERLELSHGPAGEQPGSMSFTDHVQLALLGSIRRDGRVDQEAIAAELPAGADDRDIEAALGHLIDAALIDLSLWEVGPRLTALGDRRLDATRP